MSKMDLEPKRILLVDDNPEIHADFRKILESENQDSSLLASKEALFGKNEKNTDNRGENYLIDSAYQGQEALEWVKKSVADGKPIALAFIDVRMPPGWDGVETIKQIWQVDPKIQVVICTAHSDYSWEETAQQLHKCDNFLIFKKPFDVVEIHQLASALTRKWELRRQVEHHIENLETLVHSRTADLADSLTFTNSCNA
jgi:DNA-binding NtrC family response regulator